MWLENALNMTNSDDNCASLIKEEHNTINDHMQSKLETSDENSELDIIISNVVCCFSVRCHLNLKEIALNGSNVEYRREDGLVKMRLRKPRTLASISSSGKITCIGATSESEAKIAARRYARTLQRLGFKVRFNNYRIVNVLGTCTMPWAVNVVNFSMQYKDVAQYEPEIQPGIIYRLKESKATLRIFSTGKVTVTAPSVEAVQQAIVHIYPLLHEFRKERSAEEKQALENKKSARKTTRKKEEFLEDNFEEDESEVDDID